MILARRYFIKATTVIGLIIAACRSLLVFAFNQADEPMGIESTPNEVDKKRS